MEKMFHYDRKNDFRPIPPGEKLLPTVEAEKFVQLTREKPKHTEGVIFDRNGDLYFTSTYEGRVVKVDMKTKEFTTVYQDVNLKFPSVKLHRDGRLVISCLSTEKKDGRILVVSPDGKLEKELAVGWDIDDVVFDHNGGFYFTHFAGTVFNPIGGVYYVTPDFEHVNCFIPNLCAPNGLALSTDEKVMWVTEFTGGRLLRIPMNSPRFSSVAYHFSGFYGPDSISVDAEDNVYVALFDQGRIMIFNPDGFPIGQIVMPGRDQGLNLGTSHAMVHPDQKEVYISTSDDIGEEGSWIMKAPAFATGNKKAFQFT